MARAILKTRFLSLSLRHLYKRPHDGALFYNRRIPKHALPHYSGKERIFESLGTRDLVQAAKVIAAKATRDDALWRTLTGREVPASVVEDARQLVAAWGKKPGDGASVADWHEHPHEDYLEDKYGREYMDARWTPGPHGYADEQIRDLLNPTENEALRLLYEGEAPRQNLLSEARDIYLRQHPNQGKSHFTQYTHRAIRYAIEAVGDLPLPQYSREMAHKVVAKLGEGGRSKATVERLVSVIQAVVTKGNREFELPDINSFKSIHVPESGKAAQKREPFTDGELRVIARECVGADDDIRHLIAFQLDTGSRLGELVGLRADDLFLDAPVPYVWFRAREDIGRSLKTPNSERSVPLLGMSLWSAQRLPKEGWLFPRYASSDRIKSTEASAAVNSWLRKVTGTRKTSHSFRHAMKDRLLNASVTRDEADAMQGHGPKSVSKGYGAGYRVEYLRERLALVALDPASLKPV